MSTNFTDYSLPKTAYAAFDATSLRQLIIDRLNENSIFKDQNFEGSNISAVIDLVAYMYHVLLFYLNQTSAETLFSQTTLFENMNKIVSLLNYKPIGDQTSIVSFNTTCKPEIPTGQYTIPKFSYLNTGGKSFALLDDLIFEKTNSDTEIVTTSTSVLYQGKITENPPYIATGEDFETVFITFVNRVSETTETQNEKFISDNSFRVFVREVDTGIWHEYEETSSLYLINNVGRFYEKRLNDQNQYEFKFGNDVNGRKLVEGDVVGIYYIISDGPSGEITPNSLTGIITYFQSVQFNSIKEYIYANENLLPQNLLSFVEFNNEFESIKVKERESVDEIRNNVPKLFSSQNRAVTLNDYTQYVDKNYSDIIASAKSINNNTYVNNYLRYYYSLGLSSPNRDPSVLLNQVNFMTSTNFNNIYMFVVPKFGITRNEQFPTSLSAGQKLLIVNELNKIKSATHQIVPMDPIYKAFAFGVLLQSELPFYQIKDTSYLVLKRSVLSNLNKEKIKSLATAVVQDFFDISNNSLGMSIDLSVLTNSLLSIEGVTGVLTRRVSNGQTREVPYISMVVWNPNYPTADVQLISQSLVLQDFEFPFLQQQSLISTHIIVEDE